MRAFVVLGLLFSLACVGRPSRVSSAPPNACELGWEPVINNTVRTLVADRVHENRFHLPWTDTLPLQPVRDPAICARAGRAYAGLSDDAAAPPTGVVRAGGLYFAIASPPDRAGAWTVIAVLDQHFRRIIGITT